MKRISKDTIKALERLGFDHLWTNTQGYKCYVHPGDPDQTELSVSHSLNENSARILLRSAQKIAGIARPIEKRRGSQVKERAEAEREHARERLRLAREKLARAASASEVAHHTAQVEARERELADLERMMTTPPGGGSVHRGTGQVRHCTGGDDDRRRLHEDLCTVLCGHLRLQLRGMHRCPRSLRASGPRQGAP